MRGRILGLAALCVFLSGCAGLPRPREMEDMALLRTLGVDGGAGNLIVTTATGTRASGLEGERESALVLSTRANSLAAALPELQRRSDSHAFFGYVDQLLLGETLARQGISSVLDYFVRDPELGLGAQLWVVRGPASSVVEAGGDRGTDRLLTTLWTDGQMGAASIPRRLGEVYTDLLEFGSAYVPALELGTEGENPLRERGYAVFKDGRLLGFLENEEARGLELLAGKPREHVLEWNGRGVRVYGATTTCQMAEGGQLVLDCRVSCRLISGGGELAPEERESLRVWIGQEEKSCLTAALDRLREWEADCLGMGPRGGLTAPGVWSRVQGSWSQVFQGQEPRITLRADLYP